MQLSVAVIPNFGTWQQKLFYILQNVTCGAHVEFLASYYWSNKACDLGNLLTRQPNIGKRPLCR